MRRGIWLFFTLTVLGSLIAPAASLAKPAGTGSWNGNQTVDFDNTKINRQVVSHER
jgi:hypothetical protein